MGDEKEPATAILWTYYYLAQHFDYLSDIEKAMSYIDLGLEHTPLLIELFTLKAKLMKVNSLNSSNDTNT